MSQGIHARLATLKRTHKKGFAVLLDPDKTRGDAAAQAARRAAAAGADILLVGGSLVQDAYIHQLIALLQASVPELPVVLFPGNALQIVPQADGILFLSLISGRNPDLLIGRHVEAASLLKKSELEVIPTGYMLIEAGNITTANYISQTLPIPRLKPDIAASTAWAGELLGLQAIYMDGGSGAQWPVPAAMIRQVVSHLNIPLIVGGGIRKVDDAMTAWQAGADLLVVGTALEKEAGNDLLTALGAAKHQLNAMVTS